MSGKTGLFGGTFDPPHMGHLIMAQALLDAAGLDRVIFVLSGRPPHKTDRHITAGERRLEMLRLAVAGNRRFEISDWELTSTGPCYTLETVKHFSELMPDQKLYWLIGSDSLAELPTWYEFEELICTVEILTAHRGGFDIDEVLADLSGKLSEPAFDRLRHNTVRTAAIEIASRDIRRRVADGREVRYLVPDPVGEYILREGLYRCR